MNKEQEWDHLFRQQFGKMVSILTKSFGLHHLQIIEDAVQESFIRALDSWKVQQPENPNAWLMKTARNRLIDILRKNQATENREKKYYSGTQTIAYQQIYIEDEIKDAQLRMLFTICHPSIQPIDQIVFALKTISGFSLKEISSALLRPEETVKKRLQRARKKIKAEQITFSIPERDQMESRISRIHEIAYLIFNEGFHSSQKKQLIRSELMHESIRLIQLLIDQKLPQHQTSCALIALMFFHLARKDAKINDDNQLINLQYQDRTKWDQALIFEGNKYMFEAVETDSFSSYHYEAAIVAEHLKVRRFEDTNWNKILYWYENLYILHPTSYIQLNIAIVQLQLDNIDLAFEILDSIDPKSLGQRAYLWKATYATLYKTQGKTKDAVNAYLDAMKLVSNEIEKAYLEQQIKDLS